MKLPARLGLAYLGVNLILFTACSRSNNLLLGRVEAAVGAHTVVVTDCYRLSVPPPERVGEASYRFTPCRDADVRISGDKLSVNGESYGHIDAKDDILVDHGVVKINREARRIASF